MQDKGAPSASAHAEPVQADGAMPDAHRQATKEVTDVLCYPFDCKDAAAKHSEVRKRALSPRTHTEERRACAVPQAAQLA
jgi:hypothetical protein